MISRLKIIVPVLLLLVLVSAAEAQTPVTTIMLGPDQIGKVRTAQGISTRISFPDPVYEIICGDLYDSASGKGLFVVQSSGDERQRGNSVYLKPVASKGISNLFVTTGDKGKNTYNFDLEIVPLAQAHRVVNVVNPPEVNIGPSTPLQQPPANNDSRVPPESNRGEVERQARHQADEIIRQARQQADRIIAEGEAKVLDADRQAVARGDQEVQRRLVQALIAGMREVRVHDTRTTVKKVIVALDSRIVVVVEKAYLRYTVQNTGEKVFAFNGVSLEKSSAIGENVQPIPVEVNQTKTDNILEPGEVLAGVLVFDQKMLSPRDRLALLIRGEDNAALIRVDVQ